MSILSKLTVRGFLGYPKTTSPYQELRSSKSIPKVAASEKHLEVSSQPECEPVENQLASFQYIGNVFKR